MKFLAIVCVLLFVGSVSCGRIRRLALGGPVAAAPKADGTSAGKGFLDDELEKEKALGGPVNPSGLEKASNLAAADSLESLVSGAAAQPGFGQYLSKPEDTKVNAPMSGP